MYPPENDPDDGPDQWLPLWLTIVFATALSGVAIALSL